MCMTHAHIRAACTSLTQPRNTYDHDTLLSFVVDPAVYYFLQILQIFDPSRPTYCVEADQFVTDGHF